MIQILGVYAKKYEEPPFKYPITPLTKLRLFGSYALHATAINNIGPLYIKLTFDSKSNNGVHITLFAYAAGACVTLDVASQCTTILDASSFILSRKPISILFALGG